MALLGGGTVHYICSLFVVQAIRLNLFADGLAPPKIGLRHRVCVFLGKWIEGVVNRSRESQLRFERVWCHFFPFTEIFVELQVVKSK